MAPWKAIDWRSSKLSKHFPKSGSFATLAESLASFAVKEFHLRFGRRSTGEDARAPSLQAFADFWLGESVVRSFGALVNSFHNFVRGRHSVTFQPEQHIRLAAHRSNVNDLL
jgi:hypothetical protein